MKKKGFLDLSFSWIFAFLVGAVIIFGAVYTINKISNVKNVENSAELGTALKNLLIPLESGVESVKSISISLPVESKIIHKCDSRKNFGKESISVEEKVKNRWTKTGIPVFFKDKYLFFPGLIQAKKFYVFSKPFEFPFKIANLMYFSNAEKKYCFVNSPGEIKAELKNLNQNNFEFDSCSVNSKKICFGTGSSCDILINLNSKEVRKNGEKMYFEGDALMYAAIFSDKKTYECEIQRLKKRAGKLLSIYQEKALNLLRVGCDSSLSSDFNQFRNGLSSLKGSENLYSLAKISKKMNSINKYSECVLW